MIDLHTHTNFSDGTDTYIELLKKAEEKKLEYLSITDHDNCKVYYELRKIDIKKYYSGKLIPGIELRTTALGTSIELLGYGINIDKINEETDKFYKLFENKNMLEGTQLCRICKEIGIKLDENLMDKYDKNEYVYAGSYIHKEITKYIENKKYFDDDEMWESAIDLYRKGVSNPESKFYVNVEHLSPKIQDIIDLIHEAGGLVFLPHIFVYGQNSEEILDYIVNNYKIDGVECYYSTFTQEQTDKLIKYCKVNNLYISGGSDYHGKLKPLIDIGTGMGNLNIPSEVIKDWISLVDKKY